MEYDVLYDIIIISIIIIQFSGMTRLLQDKVYYYTAKQKADFRERKHSAKRKAARMHIDLATCSVAPLSGTSKSSSFLKWLADSKLVWNQLRYEIHAKRQLKRQRV